MTPIDFARIEQLFKAAASDGRDRLHEPECYRLLEATGAEAVPESRLVGVDSRPTQDDLDAIPGDRVVLKIVSPDIIHKTEATGVRIIGKTLAEVETAPTWRSTGETLATTKPNRRRTCEIG